MIDPWDDGIDETEIDICLGGRIFLTPDTLANRLKKLASHLATHKTDLIGVGSRGKIVFFPNTPIFSSKEKAKVGKFRRVYLGQLLELLSSLASEIERDETLDYFWIEHSLEQLNKKSLLSDLLRWGLTCSAFGKDSHYSIEYLYGLLHDMYLYKMEEAVEARRITEGAKSVDDLNESQTESLKPLLFHLLYEDQDGQFVERGRGKSNFEQMIFDLFVEIGGLSTKEQEDFSALLWFGDLPKYVCSENLIWFKIRGEKPLRLTPGQAEIIGILMEARAKNDLSEGWMENQVICERLGSKNKTVANRFRPSGQRNRKKFVPAYYKLIEKRSSPKKDFEKFAQYRFAFEIKKAEPFSKERIRTITIHINQPPTRVYEYTSNPENLPKWASGLSKSIKKFDSEWWIAESPQGEVKVRFVEQNKFGVLDHYVQLPAGATVYVPMRVIASGKGSEILFTLFRQPEMSTADFDRDTQWVERDLRTLKAALEG